MRVRELLALLVGAAVEVGGGLFASGHGRSGARVPVAVDGTAEMLAGVGPGHARDARLALAAFVRLVGPGRIAGVPVRLLEGGPGGGKTTTSGRAAGVWRGAEGGSP